MVAEAVKVLFASGAKATNELVRQQMLRILPELPLVVVSEFPPEEGEWIPFHILRRAEENRALAEWKLRGRTIRVGAIILEPRIPHWPLRKLGLAMAGLQVMVFNENGNHFMLRPRSLPAIVGHGVWRAKNLVRSQFRKFRRLAGDAGERKLSILYRKARSHGRLLAETRKLGSPIPLEANIRPRGISVVIPSRNGAELLARCLPHLKGADEIIVVDNGSDDGTAKFLAREYPQIIVETSAAPLSFARAVNRGIGRARFSHVCLLNNDMVAEDGFLDALRAPFGDVPDLFASTAQIFFPKGQRREETGKTVMPAHHEIADFPVRCDIPFESEDGTYALYGSGGCTLYDASMLTALGGFDEVYEPAYVEDLDLGVRAWLRGWPTVYCAGAKVLHEHRATTSRYFTPQQLDLALETNFARFLERAIPDHDLFRQMWDAHVLRLKVKGDAASLEAAAAVRKDPVAAGDLGFLALVNGDTAVFPGKACGAKPVVLVASPYLPFPLSHGAAVRIYNLMRRAAADFDQVLVCFVEELRDVPAELREICAEIVMVRRPGTHALPSTARPDTVEEFDSPAFHQALRRTAAKWRPRIAQLEFTQMAIYGADCPGAKMILVEHDITYDLYSQMLAREEDWETRRQFERWSAFERAAWKQVDRVVTMSEKDRREVGDAVAIANGVDLDRFQPTDEAPEARRLLFIGSFAHKPNVLALEFFLRDVFPHLPGTTLHVIAGQRHERFWDLRQAGVEVEGFVSDVRPAYRRAAVVIAPLVASAGTNIKIMEAMAMSKAIVSTEAGIHGLELERGEDVMVADDARQMAEAIATLLGSVEERRKLERHARATAERVYGWDAIAREQKRLYEELL